MENNQNPGVTEPTTEPGTPETTETQPALTLEAVQKMIQSETDKVRTQYSKIVKDLESEKLELERAKMTDNERKQAEQEDLMKQLKEKEQSLLQRELEIKTIDLLKSNDLPIDFKPFVTDVSEEKITEKIEAFKVLWQDALKTAVENKFKDSGRTVKKADSVNGTITQEQFMKMHTREQNAWQQANPELFKEIFKLN